MKDNILSISKNKYKLDKNEYFFLKCHRCGENNIERNLFFSLIDINTFDSFGIFFNDREVESCIFFSFFEITNKGIQIPDLKYEIFFDFCSPNDQEEEEEELRCENWELLISEEEGGAVNAAYLPFSTFFQKINSNEEIKLKYEYYFLFLESADRNNYEYKKIKELNKNTSFNINNKLLIFKPFLEGDGKLNKQKCKFFLLKKL